MPRVTFITFDGTRHQVDVPAGTTLMQAATNNGIPGIDGDCGGQCACATCHLFIDAAWVDRTGSRNAGEAGMLEFVDDLRETSRLGCQVVLTDAHDGLVVSLPEGQH